MPAAIRVEVAGLEARTRGSGCVSATASSCGPNVGSGFVSVSVDVGSGAASASASCGWGGREDAAVSDAWLSSMEVSGAASIPLSESLLRTGSATDASSAVRSIVAGSFFGFGRRVGFSGSIKTSF